MLLKSLETIYVPNNPVLHIAREKSLSRTRNNKELRLYALTLFTLFLTVLLRWSLVADDFILVFVCSIAVITSHPLTSTVVIGVIGSILIFNLIKRRRELSSGFILGAVILILFITRNLRYESFLSSVIMDLKKPRIQPLPPISELSIYNVYVFYK